MSSCTTSTAHSCLCAAEPESCVCLCAHHTWYAHLDGCRCAECTTCTTTGGSTTACATTTTDCIDAIDEIVSTLPACPTVSTLADVVLAVRTACSGVVTTSAAYDAVYDRVSNRQVNNVNLYVHEAYALLVQGGPALPIFTYCGSIEALHTETDLYELHAFCHALYQYADVVRGINTLDRNAIRYAQQTNQTSHDRVRTTTAPALTILVLALRHDLRRCDRVVIDTRPSPPPLLSSSPLRLPTTTTTTHRVIHARLS